MAGEPEYSHLKEFWGARDPSMRDVVVEVDFGDPDALAGTFFKSEFKRTEDYISRGKHKLDLALYLVKVSCIHRSNFTLVQ